MRAELHRRRRRAGLVDRRRPSRTTVNEIVATVGRALTAEGFDVTPNRRPPAGDRRARRRARRRASSSAPAATMQQLHVLGEMDKTIACDISVARAELGYEPTVDARTTGMRRSIRWCLDAGARAVTTPASSPAATATSARCSSTASSAPGDDVRVLDIDVAGDRPAGRRVRSRPTSATPAAVRAAVDGVDVVFHNVAQVPLARDADAAAHRSTSTARRTLLDAVRATPASARSCTRRRARCSACPSRNPVLPTTRAARRSRPTATPSWPPSGRACAPPRDGLDVTIVRPAHDPRPRPPRHLRDPVRLDRRRRRPDRARRRRQPLPVRPRRRPRRRCCLLAADHAGPGDLQRRHRPLRHDARGARRRCAPTPAPAPRVRSLPAGPAALAMRASAAARASRRSRPYHWLMYAQSMWFDIDHARDALGWTPRWSNDEMFAQSYDWFLANRDAADRRRRSHHRRTRPRRRARRAQARDRRPAASRLMRAPSRRAATAGGGRRAGRSSPTCRRCCRRPGRMPADTKLYLYLDPGRLISRRARGRSTPASSPGWVPHQIIAYLWPQGPWYWLGATARPARLGRPPAVDRHAVPRRRHRRRCGWRGALGLGLAAALAAGARLPAVARTSSRTSRARRRCCCRGPASAGSSASPIGAATRTRWRHAALVRARRSPPSARSTRPRWR